MIVDFDGTIADSFDEVLAFLLQQAGRQPESVTASERQQLRGLSMRDLALTVGVPGWKLPQIYYRGRARLHRRMHNVQVFRGMNEVLATLQAENYQIFIMSSNSRRNIVRFLVQHGLSGYFKGVYGGAGWFGKGKALKRVLRQNHLQAAKTVYIGDEVRDLVGAHQAGMPAVAVTWGFGSETELLKHNPTILARQPAELQKLLVAWGKTS